MSNAEIIKAYVVRTDSTVTELCLITGILTQDERQIIVNGCLINYYKEKE